MEDYVPKNHLLKHEIQAFMLGSGDGGGCVCKKWGEVGSQKVTDVCTHSGYVK